MAWKRCQKCDKSEFATKAVHVRCGVSMPGPAMISIKNLELPRLCLVD